MVKLPVRVTLGDSYSAIRACNELESAPDGAMLDASRVTRFEPVVAAMLVATAADRRAQGLSTRWTMPLDSEAASFVAEVQMDRLVEGRGTDRHGTLEMRQLTALDPSYTADVAKLLEAGVPGMDDVAAYPVQLCLNELLQNVFEWADSKMGCIVLTRWFHRSRNVRIAVVDRGVGIPPRLRALQIQGLHRATDADVVVAAVTRPLLTSRIGRAGGLGLKTIHETVTQRGGRITVISLGAKVTWHGSRRSVSRTSPFFRGTAIEVDFRPSEPVANPDEYVSVF